MDNLPPSTPPPPASPYYQTPPKPGWWSRNWKWFVPTGCVSLLALVAVFFFVIMMIVMSAIKSSDAYSTGVQRAAHDQKVIDALGDPVSAGMFVSGNINVSGPAGSAALSVPLSGPKGSGTLYITGNKSEGEWHYSKLDVHVKNTGEIIDLRPASP